MTKGFKFFKKDQCIRDTEPFGPNTLNKVDERLIPLFRNLIPFLLSIGVETASSCQGKDTVDPDFWDIKPGMHTGQAFITFSNELTKAAIRRADRLNLGVYNGDCSICSYQLDDTTDDEIIELNKSFPARVAQLFELTDC